MVRNLARLFGAAALSIGLAACENPVTPASLPSKAPQAQAKTPLPPPPGITVSGVVTAFTATGERHPVPNLRLKVSSGRIDGAVGLPLTEVVTDTGGRYTVPNVTAYFLFFQTAPGSDYRFLCDAYPIVRFLVGGFELTELPVVHHTWSDSRPPPNMWMTGSSVWGVVSERVNGNVQPLAGASVNVDLAPTATTSASGFYMICSTAGSDQLSTIRAEKTGYDPASRQFSPGYDREVYFELTRR